MLRALALALRQLADPRTLRLLLLTAAITAAIFALAGAGLWWFLDTRILPRWLPDGGSGLAAIAALAILILGLWLLFRSVAMLVLGLFGDGVVASVEADHYPDAFARARAVGFAAGLTMGLRSAGRALAWNLIAAPAYIVLLVTGVGTLALMLLINAILLGRDFEEMVAARHPGTAPLPRAERWFLGGVGAAAFLVPIVNLAAPVLGAALAVHLHHRRHPR